MKARVKATGEIKEVSRGIYSPYQYVDKDGTIYTEDNLEELSEGGSVIFIEDTPDYWDKLLHQYAGMAMQGILSNPELFKATAKNAEEFGLIVPQAVAIDANCFATALVEKLKGK